jgi:hypothetical protein
MGITQRGNNMITIEGYDTAKIYYFNSVEELFQFLEMEGEFFFEQNLIYINQRPAFIRR